MPLTYKKELKAHLAPFQLNTYEFHAIDGTHTNICTVPSKDNEQQDVQSLHRVRSQMVARRTAQSNQIRGLLLEYGVVLPKGIGRIRKTIPTILDDAENSLTFLFRELLSELYDEMIHLDERIHSLEQKLANICTHSKDCQRLLTIPGIGLLTATALVSAISDITVFKNGRELATWLCLVPR